MKPFHLQIQLAPGVATCQWFGPSAIRAAGSSQYALRADAETHFVPDPCLIDLRPVLDEIRSENITNAETLASVDEFLLLHDLLDPEACSDLAEKLFRFLYPLSQQPETFAGIRKSGDGRVWINHDRRPDIHGFNVSFEDAAVRAALGQLFFCAPDEDVRTFKDKTTEFPHQCENRTLLISPQDHAVFFSFEKHGQQDRVG